VREAGVVDQNTAIDNLMTGLGYGAVEAIHEDALHDEL
jgi:hypothetical protein